MEKPSCPVVLHLCGSAASAYYEGVSITYATECLRLVTEHGTYKNLVCLVHVDGTWSFPADLSEESRGSAVRVTFSQAMSKIADLDPAAVMPHMFCLPGMTTFRALFEAMNVPVVGNTAGVMGISTNKVHTKAILASAGVSVPTGEILRNGEIPTTAKPFIVKPCNEDNSQGITLVRGDVDINDALKFAFQFDSEVLCETYIELGREIRVAILENDDGSFLLLPCIEYFLSNEDPIRTPQHKLVTDEHGVPIKTATGGRKCPADVDEVLTAKLKDMAIRSHKALGCRDYSLWDVRVDPKGEPFFLEACLYCSFASKSVIVAMSSEMGIDQQTVYEMLVNRSIRRKEAKKGLAMFGMKA